MATALLTAAAAFGGCRAVIEYEDGVLARPDGGANDGTDGPPREPALDAGKKCDRKGRFQSIRPVDGVNTPADETVARLTPDELVIYFDRDSLALRAERPGREAAFGPAEPVQGIYAMAGQAAPLPDELTIYARGSTTAAPLRGLIYKFTRTRKDAAFEEATPLEGIVDAGLISEGPFVTADGAELLFYGDPVGYPWDLWRMTLTDGEFGRPVKLDLVNSDRYESFPILSFDRRSLFFYSERTRPAGQGSIWMALRDTESASFREPTEVGELVPEAGALAPTWLSPDDCRLYFFKQAPGKQNDIFVAERMP
jgi:hypothetical protein